MCLLATASHAMLNCPEYCKTMDDSYCFCESGYGEYGGKKETGAVVTLETNAPIAKRINVRKPLEDTLDDIVKADKIEGKRKQVGEVLQRIFKKMGFKCFEKPQKTYKRSMDKAAWFKQLYHIYLINSNRYASFINWGRKAKVAARGALTTLESNRS